MNSVCMHVAEDDRWSIEICFAGRTGCSLCIVFLLSLRLSIVEFNIYHCRSWQVCEDCGRVKMLFPIRLWFRRKLFFMCFVLYLQMKGWECFSVYTLTNLFPWGKILGDDSILRNCCHRFSSRMCHSQSHNLDEKEKC